MNIIDIPVWKNLIPQERKIERYKQSSIKGSALWYERSEKTTRGGWQFMPVELGGVQLWEPAIEITARKNIVETPMVEMNGSVKEIVSQKDHQISIKGIIKNNTGLWPVEEVGKLVDLFKLKRSIKIKSALTDYFLNGSEYVVINQLKLPEHTGHVESVIYEIECYSDVNFELNLDNGNG